MAKFRWAVVVVVVAVLVVVVVMVVFFLFCCCYCGFVVGDGGLYRFLQLPE